MVCSPGGMVHEIKVGVGRWVCDYMKRYLRWFAWTLDYNRLHGLNKVMAYFEDYLNGRRLSLS